jgi:hypothetical protein
MSSFASSSPPTVIHGFNHRAPSIEYHAWIDDAQAYVFNQTGFAGGTMSWILFDLHVPVTIRVRPHRLVDTARLLPRRKGIKVHLEDNTVMLVIKEPGSYFLEWDDNLELPFFIFARPPENPLPAPAGRTITFGPGEHRPGRIELKTGDRLHLEGGAEVFGSIYARDASHVSITGRGVIRQSHLPFGGRGEESFPIELIDCRDIVIDGLVLADGCHWNVVFRNCDQVHVSHLTILSERSYSTDGINPCDSRHVIIEHSFIRCKDDCISVKGLQRKVADEARVAISDIDVRDCLFWSDNNNGLVVGTETWAADIHAIRFHRIDFIRISGACGDWAGAFAVQALADTHIYDIVFDDIEVECCSGNPFSILYLDEVYGIPGERKPAGALIENVTFQNIIFHEKPRRRSFIQGRDAKHRVQNVVFENVRFGPTSVLSAADLRLQTNLHVSHLTFR